MERERINVFEMRRLPPPAHEARSGGGSAVRVLALGMAIFSVIFLLCCFGIGLREQDSGPDTSEPSQLCGAISGLQSRLDALTTATTPTASSAPADTAAPESAAPTVTDIYAYDASSVPAGQTPIRPYDLSLRSYGSGFIYNSTSYSPNTQALLQLNTLPKLADTAASPVVLIIHTHGTEAYSPEGSTAYDDSSALARSSDIEENVVAVGRAMAEVLRAQGISTLHCEIMHDEQSYRDSYARSAATVKEYLKKYPTIKYVFDVHRDSVTDASGALLRPVTAANGRAVAQVMCVVGSDEGGAAYKNWQANLSFALRLREALNDRCAGLSRPVCLRSSAYNQQYAPVSLLIEVGASGNYLSEALEAGRLCAAVLAEMIKG